LLCVGWSGCDFAEWQPYTFPQPMQPNRMPATTLGTQQQQLNHLCMLPPPRHAT
jgi:hypothetical protein